MQKSCTIIQGCVSCEAFPDHLKHEAKEEQKNLIWPLTLSTKFAPATGSKDEQGIVMSMCTRTAGRQRDLENPLVGTAPGAIPLD